MRFGNLSAHGFWTTLVPPDGSLAAAAIIAEELGRALYAGPAIESLTAAYVWHRLGEPAPHPDGAFVPGNGPFVRPVPDAPLLVALGDDLAATAAGADHYRKSPSLDVHRCIVQLAPEFAGSLSTIGAAPDIARRGRAARTLLYLADTLGSVGHVLDTTTEYAGQRKAFGSPIGKYQAVAHRLVDHALTVQQMRLVLDTAISAFDEHFEDLPVRTAIAETFYHDRSSELVSDCIQLAGAIGFTWEFGHHFYLRRVLQTTALAGGFGRPAQRLAGVVPW